MPFETINAPNLAAAAAAQIRNLIATDVLRPGDQLPGERDLATQMGISRTSLRAGLQTLVAEGLLVAKHGAGLFVPKDLGRSIADPLISLIETSDEAVFDYIAFRSMVESECASIVARRGTAAEKDHIHQIHKRMIAANMAGDTALTQKLDREFHMSIVEATGNVVSIQVARSLTELLKQAVKRSHEVAYGTVDGRSNVVGQHQVIMDAILAGDGQAASDALRRHLSHFSDLIRQQADADTRQAIAEKRMDWERRAPTGGR